ncbi:intracellular growth attenuator family protein, partial [Pseudomonas aeruginosa]|nr:intracellular growth attenuator family protein [Pseudomonas aeruginosa]
MGTFLIFLTALLICVLLIGWWYRAHARRRRLPLLHAFSDATTRQLPADERQAIEKYVAELSHAQQVPASGATSAPVALALNEQSDTVYAVTRAI